MRLPEALIYFDYNVFSPLTGAEVLLVTPAIFVVGTIVVLEASARVVQYLKS